VVKKKHKKRKNLDRVPIQRLGCSEESKLISSQRQKEN